MGYKKQKRRLPALNLPLNYYYSTYSTLAALNIGHFGCGISLRSGGWIGHYYLSFIMFVD